MSDGSGLGRRILAIPFWYLNRRFATLQDHLDGRMAVLDDRLERMEGGFATDPAFAERAAPALRGLPLARVGPETAATINWAVGHEGFSAQAGLWFNPAVNVQLRPASAELVAVNERIVEVPFAMGVAAELPQGSHVVDIGSAESTVALSLASLGLHTTALDPRGYPLGHTLLDVVEEGLFDWRGPSEPLDGVFCVSTIEHLGLRAYSQPGGRDGGDREAMELFLRWLRPGGLLALTTPYGRAETTDFERTYDDARLAALLEGFEVLDQRVYRRAGALQWEPAPASSADWPDGQDGVVLVKARRR
ncbi:MAG: hypothetical protein QOE92_356 [Chloroflexota bacterium]|jgi:hypothetical protein|nr:hypothetical protein [Chloroflexota bacterium]